MNSIQQQQTEDNHQDLSAHDAIEKIKALVQKAQTCFFCTLVSTGGAPHARPMAVQQVDDAGNLWVSESFIDLSYNYDVAIGKLRKIEMTNGVAGQVTTIPVATFAFANVPEVLIVTTSDPTIPTNVDPEIVAVVVPSYTLVSAIAPVTVNPFGSIV